jgi:hypothetical protein
MKICNQYVEKKSTFMLYINVIMIGDIVSRNWLQMISFKHKIKVKLKLI